MPKFTKRHLAFSILVLAYAVALLSSGLTGRFWVSVIPPAWFWVVLTSLMLFAGSLLSFTARFRKVGYFFSGCGFLLLGICFHMADLPQLNSLFGLLSDLALSVACFTLAGKINR